MAGGRAQRGVQQGANKGEAGPSCPLSPCGARPPCPSSHLVRYGCAPHSPLALACVRVGSFSLASLHPSYPAGLVTPQIRSHLVWLRHLACSSPLVRSLFARCSGPGSLACAARWVWTLHEIMRAGRFRGGLSPPVAPLRADLAGRVSTPIPARSAILGQSGGPERIGTH